MSLQDPISDMLIRIKNAQAISKEVVRMSKSKLKIAIAKVLQEEGYIHGFTEEVTDGNQWMTIELKYFQDRPVIRRLNRVSRPSLRVYKSKDHLPEVDNGLGVAIVSTSQGVMTAQTAKKLGQGGEVLCVVS